MSRRLVLGAMLACVAIFASASPVAAAPVIKSGGAFFTEGGSCLPMQGSPGYSQQSSGVEPQVDDVFYLSFTLTFLQSFDCAASFFGIEVTLPPNVAPAIGGSAIPVCRRYGSASGGGVVFDPRAASNCPTSVSFNAGTRTFQMVPKSGAVIPDFGPPSGRFFVGQRSPQENQLYDRVQLLVPVKATATMSNQPITYLTCPTGTSCASGSVGLTVTAAPGAGDPPRISLPGAAFTSAVGARVPFTINTGNANNYYLKVDTSTSSTFSGGRPCGLTEPTTYQSSGGTPFSGDFSSEVQYGDLQTGGTTCYLVPETTYHFKACTVNTTTFAELDCKTTSFLTGSVATTFQGPGRVASDLPGNTSATITGLQVLGGHPAGTVFVQRRLKTVGGAFTTATPTSAVTQATTNSAPVNTTATGLTAWRTHELRSCLQVTSGPLLCGGTIDVVAGVATAPSDASSVTQTTAMLGGLPSAPSPAGDMRFLVGTINPGAKDVRQVLTLGGSAPIAARGSAGAPVEALVDGLAPATTYYWSACFDNPAEAGYEDCSAVRTFATPAHTCATDPSLCPANPNPNPGGSGGSGGGSGSAGGGGSGAGPGGNQAGGTKPLKCKKGFRKKKVKGKPKCVKVKKKKSS